MMRVFLSALGWAIAGAVLGFVLCVVVGGVNFEMSARRAPNADLQPGSAWFLGVIFGGLAYGPVVGALGAIIGLIVGVRRARAKT